MPERVLSQEEIDSVFRNVRDGMDEAEALRRAQIYDFRRPDRIAKEQLRAIHLLHESFARTLASSLSAYLRAYVAVNLISVEQLSYIEFIQCLPAPTCLVALALKPTDGSAVLEINPSLVFPILETLLGGSGRYPLQITREVTEIEQSVLEGVFRIVLHDLKGAWENVTNMDFSILTYETDPQLMRILAPNEAVVAVSMEVRIGERSGMMNIGIPSIIVKMLRHRFDQQWALRKTDSTDDEQARVLRLVQGAAMNLDVRLRGPAIGLSDLMELRQDDILAFDFNAGRELEMSVNGRTKYRGHVVAAGRKRAFQVDELVTS